MINLQIEQFKSNIKQTIQHSGLPIGIVYYILKDQFQEIETLYYTTLNSQILQQEKQQSQKKEQKIQDQEN